MNPIHLADDQFGLRNTASNTELAQLRLNRLAAGQNPDEPQMRNNKKFKIGFVPLVDAAPIVVAQEFGLFEKYGTEIVLTREVGWASIRDKIIYGELDATHALAAMPLAATYGLGSIPCPCATGLVLNLNGNAITLSETLWSQGIQDGHQLKREILAKRGKKIFTFGIGFTFSSHKYLLQQWLNSFGINPERDVRIVVIPPRSLIPNLASGNLDGYCVGEPWNSLAVEQKLGWITAVSADLSPRHPEKVFMARTEFISSYQDEYVSMCAALLEACIYCQQPANRRTVAELLSRPAYLNCETSSLLPCLEGPLHFGHDRRDKIPDMFVFHSEEANEPSADKGAWIINRLLRNGIYRDRLPIPSHGIHQNFREDLFTQTKQLISRNTIYEKSELTQPLVAS